jgi:quinol monooxygenase YgiN
MYIVHVFIDVKPEFREQFILATKTNAKASIQEPGIWRFDFLQDTADPNKFILVEAYRTKDDTSKHKETEHYKIWNQVVAEMMAVPRSKMIYTNIYPDEMGWE